MLFMLWKADRLIGPKFGHICRRASVAELLFAPIPTGVIFHRRLARCSRGAMPMFPQSCMWAYRPDPCQQLRQPQIPLRRWARHRVSGDPSRGGVAGMLAALSIVVIGLIGLPTLEPLLQPRHTSGPAGHSVGFRLSGE
jgi:hypothetical protein